MIKQDQSLIAAYQQKETRIQINYKEFDPFMQDYFVLMLHFQMRDERHKSDNLA